MDRIIKIGSNNVEITPQKELTDINEVKFTVWDEDNKQSYGQQRIDEEMVKIDEEEITLDNLDPVKYKTDKQAVRLEKKNKLLSIKEAMNG